MIIAEWPVERWYVQDFGFDSQVGHSESNFPQVIRLHYRTTQCLIIVKNFKTISLTSSSKDNDTLFSLPNSLS